MVITKKSFTPIKIFLLTNGMAISSWFFPDFGYLRKGFDKQFPIIDENTFIYIAIMCLFASSLWLGSKLVKKNYRTESIKRNIIDNRTYMISILLSFFGLIATFFTISKSMSINEMVTVVMGGQANTIKKALYDDYSFGFVSLRYCVILSGAFTIYRRLTKVKLFSLDLFSIVSLLLVSMISSRLTLISAVFGGLYLFILNSGRIKVKMVPVLISIAIAFLLLSAMNWSRNSNFYEAKDIGFFSAGFSEILAYTGTPMQGALYAIDNPNVGNEPVNQFYSRTTIEDSLTTNSALLELVRSFGNVGVIVGVFVLFFSGAYIAYFEKFKNGAYMYINIPIFYSVAEFWRIFLFFQGIVITLVIAALLLFFCSRVSLKRKDSAINDLI